MQHLRICYHNELISLPSMESIKAVTIKDGKRLIKVNQIAIHLMLMLDGNS